MLGREEVDEHVAKEIMKNNVSILTERRTGDINYINGFMTFELWNMKVM